MPGLSLSLMLITIFPERGSRLSDGGLGLGKGPSEILVYPHDLAG